MSYDYKRVETSADVWKVIRARHPEMKVFGSYSAPGGNPYGDSHEASLYTSYGFEHGDYPVIEVETRWQIDPNDPHGRRNERHKFWLCVPVE